MRSVRCRSAAALWGLLLALLPTAATTQPVHLFIDHKDDGARTLEIADTLGELLRGLLIEQQTAVELVPADRLGPGQDVDDYVEQFNIADFLHAAVLASDAGLFLDLRLVAAGKQLEKPIVFGPAEMGDLTRISEKIRNIPQVFKALRDGIKPENLVFVSCFVNADRQNALLGAVQRSITIGLPARLSSGQLAAEVRAAGVRFDEFDTVCQQGGRPNSDLFNYVIEGLVFPAGSASRLSVMLQVHVRRSSNSHSFNPLELDSSTALTDITSRLSDCWNRFGESDCQ